MIAKENDCENNLFVLKSGEVKCYIKIKRSQIKRHQKILETCSTCPHFLESNSKNLYLILKIFKI